MSYGMWVMGRALARRANTNPWLPSVNLQGVAFCKHCQAALGHTSEEEAVAWGHVWEAGGDFGSQRGKVAVPALQQPVTGRCPPGSSRLPRSVNLCAWAQVSLLPRRPGLQALPAALHTHQRLPWRWLGNI